MKQNSSIALKFACKSGANYIADLKKSYEKGTLIPFVGAGFSMVNSEMPSWLTLLDDLIADCNYEKKQVQLSQKKFTK